MINFFKLIKLLNHLNILICPGTSPNCFLLDDLRHNRPKWIYVQIYQLHLKVCKIFGMYRVSVDQNE